MNSFIFFALLFIQGLNVVSSNYTKAEFVSKVPNCNWQCLTGSTTKSCFCYMPYSSSLTRAKAKEFCELDEDSYLATIENQEEETMFENIVDMENKDPSIKSSWFGLTIPDNYYWSITIYEHQKGSESIRFTKSDLKFSGENSKYKKPNNPDYPFRLGGGNVILIPYVVFTTAADGLWLECAGLTYLASTGAYCRKDLQRCASNPCKNGGTCKAVGRGYECTCSPSYTGSYCEYNVVESSLNCNWTCIQNDVSACICVMNNYDTTVPLKWTSAKQMCESGGAYLARLDHPQLMTIVNDQTRKYVTNQIREHLDTNSIKEVWIGLQYTSQCELSWQNGCPSPYLTTFTEITEKSLAYWPPDWLFRNKDKINWPFKGIQLCNRVDSQNVLFSTDTGAGPFYTRSLPPTPYVGLVCRKDFNPCGSSPCQIGQTCIKEGNCYKCQGATPTIAATTNATIKDSSTTDTTSSPTVYVKAKMIETNTTTTSEPAATSTHAPIPINMIPFMLDVTKPVEPLNPEHLQQFIETNNVTSNQYPPSGKDNQPLEIGVGLYVQKLGSFSEVTNNYKIELFAYMTWRDSRLIFDGKYGVTGRFFQLASKTDQDKLWQPLVILSNTEGAVEPSVYAKNSVILLWGDGTVLVQSRVQATADCPMDLHAYPFDTQSCSLFLAIFGFFDSQMLLKWKSPDMLKPKTSNDQPSLSINQNIQLANFHILNVSFGYSQHSENWQAMCSAVHTCLQVSFVVKRSFNYHLMTLFLPTGLIVILSWLSFWINNEMVPARVALAITTFLTLQTTSTAVRQSLPAVSYLKAADIWLFLCQALVFLTLLEFVIVHAIKNGYLRKIHVAFPKMHMHMHIPHLAWFKPTSVSKFSNMKSKKEKLPKIQKVSGESALYDLNECVNESTVITGSLKTKANQIDKYARVLVPTCSFAAAGVYFAYYLRNM